MRTIDYNTITDAAIEQMASTPDPRLREVMEALVRHLHSFAREVDVTPQEWLEGIKFLTAVGQKCTPIRQEFILLSDTLGLSTLVNSLHDRRAAELGTKAMQDERFGFHVVLRERRAGGTGYDEPLAGNQNDAPYTWWHVHFN